MVTWFDKDHNGVLTNFALFTLEWLHVLKHLLQDKSIYSLLDFLSYIL